MTCSILIPSAVAEKAVKRLAKLARSAGVEIVSVPGTSIRYRLAKETTYRRCHATGAMVAYHRHVVDTDQVLECSRVTVGDMPSFNGFTLLGKITHTREGNILALARQHQDVTIPDAWRTAKATCDHCNTARSRKETFILQTPDGAIRRVGRNCLADFLMTSPDQLIALDAFEDALFTITRDVEDGDGGGGSWATSPLRLLACAAACIEASGGYISREQADIRGMRSTRDMATWAANYAYANAGSPQEREAWKACQPTSEHWATAVSAILWLEAEPATSNFIHNLKVAMLQPMTDRSTEGLIACLPQSYARAIGEANRRAHVKASAPAAAFVGTIGERSDWRVTIVAVFGYVGEFGAGTGVRMRTEEQAELIAFTTSAGAPCSDDIGKSMNVRGTVKAHKVREGVNQTHLSRPVWSE